MDKFSQQAAPLLSNPATNPFDEIPLNGDGDGVDPDEMKSLLNRVINQDYKQDPALVVELQDSLLKIQNDQVKSSFNSQSC